MDNSHVAVSALVLAKKYQRLIKSGVDCSKMLMPLLASGGSDWACVRTHGWDFEHLL